jgi:5-methyltetrahydrofolate--homocysteine methyltransferase
VAPEKFVEAVTAHSANIVGISALMTTTMPAMKRTIDALVKAGLREQVKVMIGGAPVSQAFADEIGADGYAKDSTLAVIKAKALMRAGEPAGVSS